MKKHWLVTGAIALAVGNGCGAYSVRMDPPSSIRPLSPFALSVGLGDVRTVVDGRVVPTTPDTLAMLDADFMRAARASSLFRQVVPRGGAADLVVDVERAQNTPPTGIGRTAYLVFGGPLVLAPGVPFPRDYRIGRRVAVRGMLDGTSFDLATRSATYDQRVWGATYWGGDGVDPLRESEGEYVVALLAETLAAQRDVFDGFASAVRSGDVESAHLLSVEALATRRRH